MINSNLRLRTLVYVMCLLAIHAEAQNYYKLNYSFKSSKFESFLIADTTTRMEVIGYTRDKRTGEMQDIYGKATHSHYVTRHIWGKSLQGYVTGQAADTLMVSFRNVISDTSLHITPYERYITDNNWSYRYLYIMPIGAKRVRVPYHSGVISVINIPFRIRFVTRDVDAQFLNSGVSISYVSGKTAFYRNSNITPKDWYLGIGGFLGITEVTLDSSNTGGLVSPSKNIAGLVYGLNSVFCYNGFNLTCALGIENGIGRYAEKWLNNYKLWVGFGLGYKLYDFSFGGNRANTNKR